MPPSFTDNQFHWSFSILAAIVTADAVHIGACGGFAAVMRSRTNVVPIFTPTRLVDELVDHGDDLEADAENHKYAKILCGPFFGVEDQNDLIWMAPQRFPQRFALDSQVLIGGSALPGFLESDTSKNWYTDPRSLHDAVDVFADHSTPTAIITSTKSD